MNEATKNILWIGSFRYHLGRRTYAVSEFCEALIRNWDDVPEQAQKLINRELESAFENDDSVRTDPYPRTNDKGFIVYPLGDDCDRESWASVRSLWK